MEESAKTENRVVASSLPCQACGKIFESRNLLFKHLRSGGTCGTALGWEKSGKTEIEKALEQIALLVGFLAPSFANPGETYVAHYGSSFVDTSCSQPEHSGLLTVEATLWKALDTVRGVSPTGHGSGREAYEGAGPAKLTRAARTDKGVSAVCSVLSFNTEKLKPGHSRERFVAEVNAALGGSGEVEVLDRVCVRADFHAKSSCDRRRYEAVVPVQALLPCGRGVADRWERIWSPPARPSSQLPWRLHAGEQLQDEGEEVRREGGGRRQGGCELRAAARWSEEESEEVFEMEGWEVRHERAGESMVVCAEAMAVPLPASTLVEWTQQQSVPPGQPSAPQLRLALRVGGRWYATQETFEAEGCEGGPDQWNREHRQIKLVSPFDRRKHPPVKQTSKAMPGERKKGRRGGRGGRTMEEKRELRRQQPAAPPTHAPPAHPESAHCTAADQPRSSAPGGEEEEGDGRAKAREDSEGSGGEEAEEEQRGAGGGEEGSGGGERGGEGAEEEAMRLCDLYELEEEAPGGPWRVPAGARALGLEAGVTLEGIGFLVRTEGEGAVVVRGLRVTARRAAEGVLPPQPKQHSDFLLAHGDITRVSLYRWVKGWMRKMGGRKSFHNFSVGIASSEARAQRSLRRLAVGGGMLIGGREFVVLSMTGSGFLFQQLRCMLGLLLAVAQGLVPDSAIERCLQPDAFLPVPAAPSCLLALLECAYDVYQMRAHVTLRPVRGTAAHARVLRYQQRLYGRIAEECGSAQSELRGWLRGELAGAARRLAEGLAAEELRRAPPREQQLAGPAPQVPAEYRRALQLVREADRGGRWPRSSGARRELIQGAGGDSFTMGAMPPPLRDPYANALFPELLQALQELELALLPQRVASSTVVVNRNAQFKPHKDSGAGNGQSQSLIVGLGDYSGGELAVEGTEHCIRYAPVEFDGWQQRHWTLPFAGERFSVVWFTPLGCIAPPPAPRAPRLLGDAMPAIGWGSFQLKGEAAYRGATEALRAGYRLLDTASSYKNLAELRRAISDSSARREQLFLTSKLSPAQHGFEAAMAACAETLQQLGTGYLDLLLVHWPGSAGAGAPSSEEAAGALRLETWKALEELQRRGWVRFIGVSNFTAGHLAALLPHCEVAPQVNQCEFHPRCFQRELRAFCEAHSILFQAYSPLGSPAGVAQLLGLAPLEGLAERHGCSRAQVLLAWARRRCKHLVLRSTDPAHLRANLQLPPLSEEDCGVLDAVSAHGEDTVRFCWDPSAVL